MPQMNHLNTEDCYCDQPKDRFTFSISLVRPSFSVDNLSSSRKNVAKCSETSYSLTHAVTTTSKGCFFQSLFFSVVQ